MKNEFIVIHDGSSYTPCSYPVFKPELNSVYRGRIQCATLMLNKDLKIIFKKDRKLCDNIWHQATDEQARLFRKYEKLGRI